MIPRWIAVRKFRQFVYPSTPARSRADQNSLPSSAICRICSNGEMWEGTSSLIVEAPSWRKREPSACQNACFAIISGSGWHVNWPWSVTNAVGRRIYPAARASPAPTHARLQAGDSSCSPITPRPRSLRRDRPVPPSTSPAQMPTSAARSAALSPGALLQRAPRCRGGAARHRRQGRGFGAQQRDLACASPELKPRGARQG